ncbi:MAG: undecaprenyl-diphosphate phosphatase [Leptospirales bacterium]
MTIRQALEFSVLQGTTELAPVSSLGHGVLLPLFAGWPGVSRDPGFLPFMVALHLGTALALLLYFWKDWFRLSRGTLVCMGILSPGRDRETAVKEGRTMALLVAATVPAAVLGFLLEKKIRILFASPSVAAFFLGINGIVLLVGEALRRKERVPGQIAALSFPRAVLIGTFQSLALVPGLSRSGITMVGGILNGLDHEEAARFSFLLSTPIIVGAGILEIPKLLHGGHRGMIHVALAGGVVSFVAAYLTTFILMRYFRSFETTRALAPFGVYCLGVAVAAGFWIHFH